jgi:NAD dependent epimerase/dehydratase family enzyme
MTATSTASTKHGSNHLYKGEEDSLAESSSSSNFTSLSDLKLSISDKFTTSNKSINMHFSTLMIAPFAAGFASAICPGFNFGVGNRQDLGNGISKWTVYDDSCRAVDSLTTSKNPCTTGTFGCTPAPVTFNQYTNTFSKLV